MADKLSVVIERDEHGYYAYVPALEGCQTQGDSLDEVMDNIREAIQLYMETLPDDEKQNALSREVLTTSVVVGPA